MPNRVQVVFAGLDGALPAGQKLPLMGATLLRTAARTGPRVEKVVPIDVAGVRAVFVLTDDLRAQHLVELATSGGARLGMGAGDELVVQEAHLAAVGLDQTLDCEPKDGPQLVASTTGLYDIFAVKAA